jgi:hypothetical protein
MKAISVDSRWVGCWIAFAVVSFLAPLPLGAACTCSISASVSEPSLVLKGTSSGACEWWTRIRASVTGLSIPSAFKECFGTSCSLNYPTSSACLRTGPHTARAECECGKTFTNSSGTYCDADPDRGSDEKIFFVNTTPTVRVSSSEPNPDGSITLKVNYEFPNTVAADPQRRMELFFDGASLGIQYGSQVSGLWTKPWGVACASQGTHQVKVKAVACQEHNDDAYKAESIAEVWADHEPSVHVTVVPHDPANPGGIQDAIVEYSFPQTSVDVQRLLRLVAYPSGGEWGWTRPLNRDSPPWVDAVSCFSPGDDPYVEAIAVACPSIPSARVETRHIAAIPNCPRPPRKDDGCGKSANQCCLAGGAGPGGGGPGFGGKSVRPPRGQAHGFATLPEARAVRATLARPPGTPSWAGDGHTTTPSGS